MENDLSHIHESFRHIAKLTKEERLNFLWQPRWIGYPNANRVMKILADLLRRPKQIRAQGLLLIGEPNQGKTTLIKRFAEKYGEPYIDDNDDAVMPVVYISSPSENSGKYFYIQILEYFKAPYKTSNSSVVLGFQAINLLRYHKVQMLIIDEVHSLLSGTAREQRLMMNTIKYLCNELCIPMILVGTKDAVRVLHTDPQHASRFDVLELETFSNNSDFRKMIGSFLITLPLKKPSNILTPSALNAIHSISGGNLGNIKRLLIECATTAIERDIECITEELIKEKSWVQPTKGVRSMAK